MRCDMANEGDTKVGHADRSDDESDRNCNTLEDDNDHRDLHPLLGG